MYIYMCSKVGVAGVFFSKRYKVGGAALHLQLALIMAESSLVESVPRIAPSSPAGHTKPEGYSSTHLQRSSQEPAPPPPPATTRMAYVVNSIKEGFRKLGGGRGLASDGHHARTGRRRSPFINHGQITENLAPDGRKYARREGGNLWGVKRKVKGGEREVSFEMYLSSLPKADPVDRTVHWLFHHHGEEAGSRDHEGHRVPREEHCQHQRRLDRQTIAHCTQTEHTLEGNDNHKCMIM